MSTDLTGKEGSYSNSLMEVGYPTSTRCCLSRLKLIDSYWGDLYTENGNINNIKNKRIKPHKMKSRSVISKI